MCFIKYPSLTPVHRAIKKKKYGQMANVTGYVSEKIHGANFQIVVSASDPNSVKFCSRARELDKDNKKDFFNFEHLRENLIVSVYRLLTSVGAKSLNIYGEIFGGNIQRKIWYQKEHQFRVFDVLVNGDYWLDYSKFEMVEDAGFKIIPMKKTTLKEFLDIPVEFSSEFSKKKTPDRAEGLVFKTNVNGKFVGIKHKAASFREAHTGAIVQNKVLCITPIETSAPNPGLESYINANRVDSWFSKNGIQKEFNNEKRRKRYCNNASKGVINDAIDDYMEDHEDADKNSVKREMFGLFNDCSTLVENYLEKQE